VALRLANLANNTQANLNGQTFGDYYNETVTGLGDSLQTANTRSPTRRRCPICCRPSKARSGGVNIDEEMTNLMGFQRAYEASAQTGQHDQ